MTEKDITISDRMTPTPHLIGAEQSLKAAHALMRSHDIRHLPVLHGGKLIGVTLVGESLGQHIPKGYIYFSMAFAFGVEMLNLRLHSKEKKRPVELHQPYR